MDIEQCHILIELRRIIQLSKMAIRQTLAYHQIDAFMVSATYKAHF